MLNRFAITYVNSDGRRVHYHQNAGYNFFDTQEEGEQRVKDIIKNNNAESLASIFGEDPKWKVIPIECYDNGDAKRNIFEP